MLATVSAYGYQCRKWDDSEMVQDFNPAKFYGFWFPKWVSKTSPEPTGQCPVWYFDPWKIEGRPLIGLPNMKRLCAGADRFKLKTSY